MFLTEIKNIAKFEINYQTKQRIDSSVMKHINNLKILNQ